MILHAYLNAFFNDGIEEQTDINIVGSQDTSFRQSPGLLVELIFEEPGPLTCFRLHRRDYSSGTLIF